MNGTATRIGRFYLILIGVMLFCGITASARLCETALGALDAAAYINEKNPAQITVSVTPGETFLSSKKGETLYLFILAPHETTAHLRTASPTATKVVDKTISFSVTADDDGERYRAKYILALGEGADYRVVGECYVENPQALSENDAKRLTTATKKGITYSGALSSDIATLGIGHAVIPIVIDDYITAAGGDPQYSRATLGVSTHFDKTRVARLDAQVAALQETGVQLYFRFILSGSDRNTTEPTSALYGANATDGAGGYGITPDTNNAYQVANNVFTFFAERYAKSAQAPIDFILGYQVNEWAHYYALGIDTKDADTAAKAYAFAFRLCDAALRANSENSRVYVPISNLWASAKPFLQAFAKEMGAQTAWSVAIAPYASDPMDDSIWEDAKAQNDPASHYLTVKNLELLGDFLKTEEMMRGKYRRAVIVDDFAVHGTSGDLASQERQAASFVYAYYKVSTLDFVDAFIWHRLIDGAGEHCSLGLRQLDASEKPVYRLFATVDTPMGEDMAKEYAKIAGVKKWTRLIDGFSQKDAETAVRHEGTGTAPVENTFREEATLLLDFSARNLRGFVPGDNAKALEVTQQMAEGAQVHVLRADLYPVDGTAKAGLMKPFASGEFAKNTKTLYLTVEGINKSGSVGTPMPVTLILGTYGAEHALYVGNAEIRVGEVTPIAFDISDFTADVGTPDYMKLLVGGLTSETVSEIVDTEGGVTEHVTRDGGSLVLYDIRYDVGFGALIGKIIGGVLIALVLVVVLFFLLVLRARYIRKKHRALRRKQIMAQRRAAAMRAQAQKEATQRSYIPKERTQNSQNGAQMRNRNTTPNATQYTGHVPGAENAQATPPRRTAQRRPDMYHRK